MDKTENVISIARKYAELVKGSNLPIQIDKVYLFGFFAKGTPNKDSNIRSRTYWWTSYDNFRTRSSEINSKIFSKRFNLDNYGNY